MLFMFAFLAAWVILNSFGAIFTFVTGYDYGKLPQVKPIRRTILLFYAPLILVAFVLFVIKIGQLKGSWGYWDDELNLAWDFPDYVPFAGWQLPRDQ